ncbi:MFS transporter [Shimia sp.]|uniref:MFS transporter n=1 Tax=Shimia sp. TaxID=1954381 RepID=UPI003297B4F3
MPHSQQRNGEAAYVGRHGLAQLLLWSAFYYLLPALSGQIALETDWSVLFVSSTFTLAFLLWALCAPIVGRLIDAGFGAAVIRTGAIAGTLILLCLSQTSDKVMFSVLVVLLGICMAATLYDPCFAMMMRRLKVAGTNAVASVTLIAGFATLLTFPLVIVLSSGMGWQRIVLVFAALAAIAVVALPKEITGQPDTEKERAGMRLEKGPVLIALAFGLVMMGHAILLFLLPVVLMQGQGDTSVALLSLAILGPAQIAGRVVWKYYGAAFSPQNCAAVMFVCLCLPASLLLFFGTAPFIVYAALIVQGACYGIHTILRPGLAQRYLAVSHLGRGLGMIAMVGLLMMALGPAIGGAIWTFAGATGLIGSILVINGLALVLGLVLRGVAPKEALV